MYLLSSVAKSETNLLWLEGNALINGLVSSCPLHDFEFKVIFLLDMILIKAWTASLTCYFTDIPCEKKKKDWFMPFSHGKKEEKEKRAQHRVWKIWTGFYEQRKS